MPHCGEAGQQASSQLAEVADSTTDSTLPRYSLTPWGRSIIWGLLLWDSEATWRLWYNLKWNALVITIGPVSGGSQGRQGLYRQFGTGSPFPPIWASPIEVKSTSLLYCFVQLNIVSSEHMSCLY